MGGIRPQKANISLPSGLKEFPKALFRASVYCCGALGFYFNWEALRVNIILIPQNPPLVRAGRRMDSRKYVLFLT